MKPWQSISTRLTLTLVVVSLGSLIGLSLILDTALKQFFVQDAQKTLQRQASTLAVHASSGWRTPAINQLADLTSQQGKVQVLVFNSARRLQVASQGVQLASRVEPPPFLIAKTLIGMPQEGQFWVATDAQYPWWLYSTAPVRDVASDRVLGAVYVAMPLRRPKEFAQQVKGMVMGMAIAAATIATTVGLFLSQTLTHPLQRLHRQAQRLEAGDYTARSALKGEDELAQLSRLLDQMTRKLTETLAALKAQETARRELVANVSHDLRTPLASLRVGLEAVTDGVVEGEKAQQYLKRACRETDYLARLVEQLLLLSKADAGQLQVQPQAVSAVAIAQECLSRMQPSAAQAGLALELCAASYPAQVWVDPELTGQVVLNLLDNAIKYAPDSKAICLKVLPPLKRDQHHYVPLQVQDQGRGMAREVVQQVTERFYRGEGRPRGGLGLGLAIAQQVCQLQGGTLQIESQLKQGTVVTLFLPVAD